MLELVKKLCEVGEMNPMVPDLSGIDIFRPYLDSSGRLFGLDTLDNGFTRREIVTRFLLLSAVLDQGPDIQGVRDLVKLVVNDLYLRGYPILHDPTIFFRELNCVNDLISQIHSYVKNTHSFRWAKENNVQNPDKYLLYIDGAKQVLNYACFRWGVPLGLMICLIKENPGRECILVDYLENNDSSEMMSILLKDDEKYGLGKAIGDKACHLFAKWYVSTYNLCKKTGYNWGDLSYEVPYDSNAGRVLWRTGYLLKWAYLEDYIKWEVIQKGKGKKGLDYIRVTNMRGKKVTNYSLIPVEIEDCYNDICINYLKTNKINSKPEIQRIQHAFMLNDINTFSYSASKYDDGLMHIGTKYCYNHENPKCDACPLNHLCDGYKNTSELIKNYRT